MALCIPLSHLLPLLLQLLPEIHIALIKWHRYTSLLHSVSSRHTSSCTVDNNDFSFSKERVTLHWCFWAQLRKKRKSSLPLLTRTRLSDANCWGRGVSLLISLLTDIFLTLNPSRSQSAFIITLLNHLINVAQLWSANWLFVSPPLQLWLVGNPVLTWRTGRPRLQPTPPTPE